MLLWDAESSVHSLSKADPLKFMEQIGVRSKRIMRIFIALYVLALLLRPVQGFPSMNASLFIPSAIAIGWAQSIKERITDKVMRYLLIGISHMLVFLHVLQMCKYDFFEHIDIAQRYLWYGYYIPLIVIPLLSLYASMNIGNNGKKQGRLKFIIPFVICLALVIIIMTNDIHGLVFKFAPDLNNWSKDYKRGIGFIVINVWIYGMMVLSLINAVRSCALSVARRLAWIPLVTLIFAIILLAVFFLEDSGATRQILGVRFFTFPFVYNVMFIMFWESVIKIGLIPSNTEYGGLFNLSSINAQITDMDGEPVLKSAGAMELNDDLKTVVPPLAVAIDADTKLYCSGIGGGKVYWEEDIRSVTGINNELLQVFEELRGENVLLLQEMRLKQDKVNVDTANRLYDEIAESLRPYLVKIQGLLDKTSGMPEVEFKRVLAEATIYGTYVKRKANLILTGRDKETLDVRDLKLAIGESLEYAKGLRISSDIHVFGEGEVPVDALLEAYDRFEARLESRMYDATDIQVIIDARMGFMRMSIFPDRDDPITCSLTGRRGKKDSSSDDDRPEADKRGEMP